MYYQLFLNCSILFGYLLITGLHIFNLIRIEPTRVPLIRGLVNIYWELCILETVCSNPKSACNHLSASATSAIIILWSNMVGLWVCVCRDCLLVLHFERVCLLFFRFRELYFYFYILFIVFFLFYFYRLWL